MGSHIIRRESHAIGNPGCPIRIIGALAGFEIKQFTGGAGVDVFARILVFQLVKAAAAAAVAQAFPLLAAHLAKGLGFPERRAVRHNPLLNPFQLSRAIAFRACCGKVADFADDNMLQVNDLARILFVWVVPPKRKAR